VIRTPVPSLAAPAAGLLLAVAALPAPPDEEPAQPVEAAAPAAPADVPAPLRVERGEGLLPVYVPRAESLTYRVHVGWGVIGAALGTVTMTSGVETYQASLIASPIAAEGGDEPAETAWMKAHASGEHLLYSMDSTIETRIQPQVWPRIVHRYEQQGSENRRREILLGWRDDEYMLSYRRDTSTGAPRGTRVWHDAYWRTIPEDSVDMVSGVYLLRTLMIDDVSTTSFPLVSKRDIWLMNVETGAHAIQEIPAGRFQTTEIVLAPEVYPGEDIDDEEAEDEFRGMFGLHGTIKLWAERRTGVVVRVQGLVPVGPVDLEVDIALTEYRGTPTEFQPIGGG